MFPVHATLEEFKNVTITCHWEKFCPGNHVIILTSSLFRKAPFSKCFPFSRKQTAGVFKFLRFEERFRKAPNVERRAEYNKNAGSLEQVGEEA